MGNRESKEADAKPSSLSPPRQQTSAETVDPQSSTTSTAAPDAAIPSEPRPAALGEWESPITSAFITEKAVRLGSPQLRASDGALFWLEGRPDEAGRQVLVMRSPADGSIRDVTPGVDSGFNVRTTVHEYGGFEYCLVEENDRVYFSNYSDQALYVQDIGDQQAPSPPRLVTHGSVDRGERFADACWDATRRRLVSVSELHRDSSTGAELPPDKVVNRLVAIDVSSGAATPLASGADFYAAPRPSPCGRWLAWVEWDFPNMPWDCTRLMVAPVGQDGTMGQPVRIAGGSGRTAAGGIKAAEGAAAAAAASSGSTTTDGGGGGDGNVDDSNVNDDGSAVQQPVWSPDGSYLYFIDDRTGWWNLYRCRTPTSQGIQEIGEKDEEKAGEGPKQEVGGSGGSGGGDSMRMEGGWEAAAEAAESLSPMQADWGFPLWTLDRRSYQVLSDGSVLAVFCDPRVAGTSLALLQPPSQPSQSGAGWQLTRIDACFTHFGAPILTVREAPTAAPAAAAAGGSGSGNGAVGGNGNGNGNGGLTVAAVAASPSRAAAVVQLSVTSAAALASVGPSDWLEVRKSTGSQLPGGYLSVPEALSYPTTFDDQPTTAHMLFYPPTNKDFTHLPGSLPPLLVKSHGGPTSAASTALSPLLQYWTSRGFAVADVDYGGSTGYGREYRNRLRERWGLVDVQDCCAAAEWLVAQGRVDPRRLCISGGSAGGFTTLACLAFRRTFSAGASLYGVADLRLLAEHTHKFESRYLDLLLGPLPAAADVYEARSPLKHAEGFAAPVIFFQGDQDKVVPPEQALQMYEAIKAAGLPTGLVMMAGEQHGFRQAINIRTALDGELYFYGAVLGFKASMPGDLPEIKIDNLKPSQGQQ